MQDERQNEVEEERDTRETDAVSAAEVTFGPEAVEAVGDPAAAGVDADPGAGPDPVAVVPTEPPAAADAGYEEQSPLDADRRGAEQAEDPPIAAIAGAFVGAFVVAKLIGRIGGGDD